MKKIIIQVLILLGVFETQGQSFQQFLNYVNALPQEQRQARTDSFINANAHLPFTESDTICTFIYKGTAQSVTVAGDFTGWNPNLSMSLIAGTDFHYYTTHFEVDARLDYKLVTNGSNWILDPKNPYTCTGGFGPNSELRMPAYLIHPETQVYLNIPHGTIVDTSFHSTILQNTRAVRIYLPAGYIHGSRQYPVILVHDGPEYINLGQAGNILDYLIANQSIQPVIGVFVAPVNRNEEYNGNLKEQFTSFVVTELMPFIDQHYSTSSDPQKRALLGASSGGNISFYIGMKHPELFGKIAAQSSSVETIISNTYQNSDKMNLEIYLDNGAYDIPEIISWVRNMNQILHNKEYTVQYHEWHEGHSWGNWRDHLILPLKQFFTPGTGLNSNPETEKTELKQNIPNPFSGTTVIGFNAPPGSYAELDLFNLSGKQLKTLFKGMVGQGETSIRFISTGLAAGSYLYSLKVDQSQLTKIMNIE